MVVRQVLILRPGKDLTGPSWAKLPVWHRGPDPSKASLAAWLETSFFRHQHFDDPRGAVHAVTADKVKSKPRECGGKLPKPQSLKVTGASDIKFNMILFDPMYPKILSFQHIINIKMLAAASILPF